MYMLRRESQRTQNGYRKANFFPIPKSNFPFFIETLLSLLELSLAQLEIVSEFHFATMNV